MKKLFSEIIEFPRWEALAWLLLFIGLSGIVGAALGNGLAHGPKPVAPHVELPPELTSKTPIQDFGIRTLYPQWFTLGQKNGEPIIVMPDPDQAVFVFPVEPKIERLEIEGRSIWKVTFEP